MQTRHVAGPGVEVGGYARWAYTRSAYDTDWPMSPARALAGGRA
jgi:hypothetical protein